jgi:hypothetical protein
VQKEAVISGGRAAKMSYISKIKAAGMSDFATQIVNAFM